MEQIEPPEDLNQLRPRFRGPHKVPPNQQRDLSEIITLRVAYPSCPPTGVNIGLKAWGSESASRLHLVLLFVQASGPGEEVFPLFWWCLMIRWLYFVPLWQSGILTVLVFCAFGITGLVVTRRWVPSLHHATVSYNDIVGYYFGAVTLLYGITLGLLMVGDWSTLTETQEKVDREASTLAAFYLDVSQYPEPHRGRLQNDLRRYTREVIDVAWPEQQKGIVPKGNVANVADLANDLAAFEPASEEQKILDRETYDRFNELVERRRSRLLGVTAGLSGALWALVYLGAVINIAVTWCFHLQNRRMHLWMTALTSALLGLMIFLLSAMDHPYLGQMSVSLEPFQLIYDDLMKSGESAPGSSAPSGPQTR